MWNPNLAIERGQPPCMVSAAAPTRMGVPVAPNAAVASACAFATTAGGELWETATEWINGL